MQHHLQQLHTSPLPLVSILRVSSHRISDSTHNHGEMINGRLNLSWAPLSRGNFLPVKGRERLRSVPFRAALSALDSLFVQFSSLLLDEAFDVLFELSLLLIHSLQRTQFVDVDVVDRSSSKELGLVLGW